MKLIEKYSVLLLYLGAIVSFILHAGVFKLDLVGIHVWRQTETQTVINNFYRDDLNIFNPHINDNADTDRLHRIEFPLMQWFFALFYRLLGPHIAISRLLSFLIGLFSVYGMFFLCKSIFKNNSMAAICAWCFNFSPVFYYYTLNPMPDNLALCFGIWSIGVCCYFQNHRRSRYILCSAIFLSLASLVKLPFIVYGSFVFSFLFMQLKRKELSKKQWVKYMAIYFTCLIPAMAWYAAVIPGWHNGVIKGILDARQSSRGLIEILWGNVVSVLPELLINYGSAIFFMAGICFVFSNNLHRKKIFPVFFFWSVSIALYFLYEMNMIDTIHDYYMFPFLPPIFLLVTYGVFCLLSTGSKSVATVCIVCLTILPFTAFLRINSRWDVEDPGFNPIYFEDKKELRSLTPQNDFCIVGNDPSHYILLYYIDRKGWSFTDNALDGNLLSDYISKGAKYLFLDARIDDSPSLKIYLDEKIFDKGTLRVYKLKNNKVCACRN